MPKVIYEMGVSADGYIVGPDGKFDWAAPDEELHRFHNERARALGGHLLGRRLYETMVYWETAGDDPSEIARDFAQIWQALPKVVFSQTLTAVEGREHHTRTRGPAHRADRAARRPPAGTWRSAAPGSPPRRPDWTSSTSTGCSSIRSRSVAGIPFFPRDHRADLELLETRTFGSRVVFQRYRATGR